MSDTRSGDPSIVESEPAPDVGPPRQGLEPRRPLEAAVVDRIVGNARPSDVVMDAVVARTNMTMTTRESASGSAAHFTAISKLPIETQLKHLDNEDKAQDREFQLEKYRLDVMARDRGENRTARAAEKQNERKATQRTETQQYGYVVGISVVLIALVALLFLKDKDQYAAGVLSSAVTFGAGWLGGKGSGYKKAIKEHQDKKTSDEDD